MFKFSMGKIRTNEVKMIKIMREKIDNRYAILNYVDNKKTFEINNVDIEAVKDWLELEGISETNITQTVALVRFTKYPAVLDNGRMLGVVK